MTYEEFSKLPASEKVALVTVEANTQFKLWQAQDGYFFRDVPYFVVKCKNGSEILEQVFSLDDISENKWFFDSKNMRLYTGEINGENPVKSEFICTYKFFFATTPQKLPYDLDNGEVVEWDGRVTTIGSLGQQLDEENTGVVMESSSSVSFINTDAFFDGIFDTLIWENQLIEFFSWSPKIPITEAVLLFSGVVESKTFASDKITFKTKDFIYRLKDKVRLSVFTEADGNIAESILGTPKRRVYGMVKQMQTVGIDCILKGISISGTVSVDVESNILTGAGTYFLKELSPDDELLINSDDGENIKLTIESIESDTSATLSSASDYSILNKEPKLKPQSAYRYKNRRWHIAGHKLRAPESTIESVTTSRRFVVNNINDFLPSDIITINGQTIKLRRISKQNFVLASSAFPVPAVGDKFKKNPVQKVLLKDKELVHNRDWKLDNSDTGAVIVLNDGSWEDHLHSVEFNIAEQKSSGVNFTFTSGSRTVTTSATLDLRTIVNTRDWIKINNLERPEWYEVLSVSGQTITLRKPVSGSTVTASAKIKNIEAIDDDSLITVDCIGAESLDKSTWIRTASDAVKHLVQNDAGFSLINEASFAQAKVDCSWMISMVIPKSIGSESPKVRDVITDINASVFGSLYGNKSQRISFSILNARKPDDLAVIRDDDITGWTSSTDQKIVNKVKINYRPFIDVYSESDALEFVEYDSGFVNNYVGIENTDERTCYLYYKEHAEIMAQRVAFFKSLSNCKITLKGKLNLGIMGVNDKVYIELRRIFNRFGGNDARKIGIVTGVKRNGFDADVELTDLGNLFNRVPSISPNTLSTYENAEKSDIVKYGFILDNSTLTPLVTSEDALGSNRIG